MADNEYKQCWKCVMKARCPTPEVCAVTVHKREYKGPKYMPRRKPKPPPTLADLLAANTARCLDGTYLRRPRSIDGVIGCVSKVTEQAAAEEAALPPVFYLTPDEFRRLNDVNTTIIQGVPLGVWGHELGVVIGQAQRPHALTFDKAIGSNERAVKGGLRGVTKRIKFGHEIIRDRCREDRIILKQLRKAVELAKIELRSKPVTWLISADEAALNRKIPAVIDGVTLVVWMAPDEVPLEVWRRNPTTEG